MIRSITELDWPCILAIQAAVYPSITPETETVLRSKLELGSQTCLAITDETSQVIAGYCLAHPWHEQPASLHTIYSPSQSPQLLYIHDIAIAPRFAGKQFGSQIMCYLESWTRKQGFQKISLVSLQQAISYWQHHGFAIQNQIIDETDYGAGACYMLKQL